MPSHEMRLPTEGRPVVRRAGNASHPGAWFYRAVLDDNPFGHGGILNDGMVGQSTTPVSHRDDRMATIDRPMILVTPMGRLYRTWYDTVGCFRVEVAA